jgi:micrococcal nuclease
MRCPECGAESSAGVRYCRECDSDIDRPAAPDEEWPDRLAAAVPLLDPGATARNVLVAVLYLAFLPFTVAGGIAYAVGTNRYGMGDRLADSPLGRIPTVENGGWQAAASVFVAVLVFFALAGAALPGGDGGVPAESGLSDRDPEATEGGQLEAATPTGTPATDGGTVVTQTRADGAAAPPASRASTTAERATATARATSTAAGPSAPTASRAPTATPTATPTPRGSSRDGGRHSSWTVTVLEVVDGDTMDVRMPDGSEDTIRLLGVDTPETSAARTDPDEWEGVPDSADGREWLASWGDEATGYAEQRVGGLEIYVETDPESDRRGSYGRLLVYAYRSESSSKAFNRRLIENGYARMYDTQFEQRSTYRSAESRARSNDVGVWGYEGAATATPGGGHSDGGLYVSAVNENAPEDDHENPNGEWVEFTNGGDSAIEMGGWTVADEADHDYHVPSGFSLEPGASVTLYTGEGEDTDAELYWDRRQAVWNNGGDTIYVRTDGGETVVEHEYAG